MSKLTFFKSYNNYYNRIVKDNVHESLGTYTKISFDNINFNPANEIETKQIINWSNSWTPDYMMVDLTAGIRRPRWTDYLTGFYFSGSAGYNDIDISGTNEEVKAELHHYPVWDEDYEEYLYSDYMSADDTIIYTGMIEMDFRSDIDRYWYSYGFNFTNLRADALNMKLDQLSIWPNPVTEHYDNIYVQCTNPNIFVSFKSTDIPVTGIDLAFLQSLNNTITASTLITNIEFNPNTQDDVTVEGFTPNEVLADTSLDYINQLESSWFVIDMTRTRKGQYEVTLKRDLVADKYDNVLKAPMIVDRGMVPYTNNLIFNDEGMSFNEIKTSEELLNDSSSRFPWIVLYMAKNMSTQSNISVDSEWTGRYDELLNTTLENSIYNPNTYNSKTQAININFRFTAQYSTRGYTNNWRDYLYNTSTGNLNDQGGALAYPRWSRLTSDVISNNNTQLKSPLNRALDSSAIGSVLTAINDSETGAISNTTRNKYEEIMRKGSIIVKDSDGKYYEITVEKQSNNSERYLRYTDAGYNQLVSAIKTQFPNFTSNDNSSDHPELNYKPFYTYFTADKYIIRANYLANLTFTVTVDPTGKNTTKDSECNILLIPYADCYLNTTVPAYSGTIRKEDQLNIARAIAKAYTNSVCYDMQLLPYAPPFLRNVITGTNIPTRFLDEKQFTLFTYDGASKGVMFWSDVANFSFDINKTIAAPTNDIDFKLAVNCDKYRLVSPNYNGQFEFNVARNRGITSFSVDVTYRPYNPYIHINPNFKALYGNDYDDARGLICQGDFSLPITGDAFSNYELTNKNYLNVFNREIQHMDFENKIANRNAIATAITGTLTGTATGAGAGAMAGGGYGAIAGGIVGGTTSGIGGVLDVQFLREQQKENKDLAIDMFNYQLGNVKALPYSLNKVTPLTYNNKIFPFIEYYTCTDEEKNILRNKITYTSMNLNTIDTIGNLKTNYSDELNHFYQGTPIRLEDVDLTADELYEIFNELKKGVYI